ncbi:hypothetical protein LUZ60_004132 [Juncus effusus]|nr:hypothetical protein LUZ60_004132 [Juncus effusus]
MRPTMISVTPSSPSSIPLCNTHTKFPAKTNSQLLSIPDFSSVSNPKTKEPIQPLSLLRSYTNGGQMESAHKLFDQLPVKTLPAWTILMSGYANQGNSLEALFLLRDLLTKPFNDDDNASLWPDPFVFSVALKACASMRNLSLSRELHCLIVKLCTEHDLFVSNGLVTMYASCNCLVYSERVFNGISNPDLVSWASILNAYVKNEDYNGAFNLLIKMAQTGTSFDSFALSIGLKAASYVLDIKLGSQIHCYMIKLGLRPSIFLENCLLEFYGRTGELSSMQQVFDEMPERNLVSWNTVIECYSHNFNYEKSLILFHDLIFEDLKVDQCTIGSTLQAVTALGQLKPGKQIHGFVTKLGFGSNSHVISALLDMYINLASDKSPIKILKDYISTEAKPDEFIMSNMLKSCANHMDLGTGKIIHGLVLKLGMNNDLYVNISLMDMYSKCGNIDAISQIFLEIRKPNLVSWSMLISGYNANNNFEKALEIFRDMQLCGVKPNEYIYTSILFACISLRDFRRGMEIHCNLIKNGYGCNVAVLRILLKLYKIALKPFECAKLRSFLHEENLKLFLSIQNNNGFLTSDITCNALNSCGKLTLLNLGFQIHAYITKRGFYSDYKIKNSLITMYSNLGNLSDANKVFDEMPQNHKNSHCWTLIIRASVHNGIPHKALELFMEMLRNNKLPNCNTFLFVLKACEDLGLVDLAFQVFESMDTVYDVNPTRLHYSCMVQVLEKAGMSEEALHFVNSEVLASVVLD